MKSTSISLTTATMVTALFSLAGCGSGEPSESEMFDAMLAYDQGQAIFGRPDKFREDAKKLGCEKAGEKTYKCQVGKRDGTGGAMPVSLIKTDGRWLMTGVGASAG